VRVKKLVEFSLYGLSVAVFSALDEERHDPNDDGCDAVPVKRPGSNKYQALAYAKTIKNAKGCPVRTPSCVSARRIKSSMACLFGLPIV
jgi:hypothetical protein